MVPLGQPLLARLEQTRPDFFDPGWGLPDISGFELCKRVRALTDIPLMFLTARSEEIDRLIGLEIGQTTMWPNLSPREVCARVRVILRRSQPALPADTATRPGRGAGTDLLWPAPDAHPL